MSAIKNKELHCKDLPEVWNRYCT